MKIEFYIPTNEKIPTRLRLLVDGMHVYYNRVEDDFAYDFTLWGKARDNATDIVNELVRILCSQSFDHGAEWRETKREVIEEGVMDWEATTIRVFFRIKDSY
jgi:hypothetical protein